MRKKLSEQYNGKPDDFDDEVGQRNQRWVLYIIFPVIILILFVGIYTTIKNNEPSSSDEIQQNDIRESVSIKKLKNPPIITDQKNNSEQEKIIAKQNDNKVDIQYGRPIMAMWSGVKLYYGSGNIKKYIGKIICFAGDELVKIEYPTGNQEWKYRKSIINLKDNWFIDKNDSALNAMEYYECN